MGVSGFVASSRQPQPLAIKDSPDVIAEADPRRTRTDDHELDPGSRRPDRRQKMPKPGAVGQSSGICSASLIALISRDKSRVLASISRVMTAVSIVVV